MINITIYSQVKQLMLPMALISTSEDIFSLLTLYHFTKVYRILWKSCNWIIVGLLSSNSIAPNLAKINLMVIVGSWGLVIVLRQHCLMKLYPKTVKLNLSVILCGLWIENLFFFWFNVLKLNNVAKHPTFSLFIPIPSCWY